MESLAIYIAELTAAVCIVLVTRVLVPFIRSRLTSEQTRELESWVRAAVKAAEQMFSGDGRGLEKSLGQGAFGRTGDNGGQRGGRADRGGGTGAVSRNTEEKN